MTLSLTNLTAFFYGPHMILKQYMFHFFCHFLKKIHDLFFACLRREHWTQNLIMTYRDWFKTWNLSASKSSVPAWALILDLIQVDFRHPKDHFWRDTRTPRNSCRLRVLNSWHVSEFSEESESLSRTAVQVSGGTQLGGEGTIALTNYVIRASN